MKLHTYKDIFSTTTAGGDLCTQFCFLSWFLQRLQACWWWIWLLVSLLPIFVGDMMVMLLFDRDPSLSVFWFKELRCWFCHMLHQWYVFSCSLKMTMVSLHHAFFFVGYLYVDLIFGKSNIQAKCWTKCFNMLVRFSVPWLCERILSYYALSFNLSCTIHSSWINLMVRNKWLKIIKNVILVYTL